MLNQQLGSSSYSGTACLCLSLIDLNQKKRWENVQGLLQRNQYWSSRASLSENLFLLWCLSGPRDSSITASLPLSLSVSLPRLRKLGRFFRLTHLICQTLFDFEPVICVIKWSLSVNFWFSVTFLENVIVWVGWWIKVWTRNRCLALASDRMLRPCERASPCFLTPPPAEKILGWLLPGNSRSVSGPEDQNREDYCLGYGSAS